MGARATMPDQYLLALLGPCPDENPDNCHPPPRICTRAARIDRSNGPAPANGTEAQLIYFLASNTTANNWDQPTGCADGYSRESTIGYSVTNSRKFMASSLNHGERVSGKFFDTRRRSYQAHGKTFGAYEVIFFRAEQNEAYFAVDTLVRTRQALRDKGLDRLDTKYWIYADVIRGRNPDGRVILGEAEHSDSTSVRTKFANAYARYTGNDGQTKIARWGCADEYDIVPMHETMHTYHLVQSGRPDSVLGDTSHATQPEDILYPSAVSSYTGFSSRGSSIVLAYWDFGADTYTTQLTTDDAEYLASVSGYGAPYTTCDPYSA